jgi:hypothetical protein
MKFKFNQQELDKFDKIFNYTGSCDNIWKYDYKENNKTFYLFVNQGIDICVCEFVDKHNSIEYKNHQWFDTYNIKNVDELILYIKELLKGYTTK